MLLTATGVPFIAGPESRLDRPLKPQKRGPKPKGRGD